MNIQDITIYTVGTTTKDGPYYIASYDNKEAAEQHVAHLRKKMKDNPWYGHLNYHVWDWKLGHLKSEFKGGE